MGARLPYEVREAVVQACGKAFWLKDPLRGFLLSCGVSMGVLDRYADEAKFKIARHVLAELDAMGDEGLAIQRRILTELCRLRSVPDSSVTDRDGALQALRLVKELAVAHEIVLAEERSAAGQRAREADARQAALAMRAEKVEELRRDFYMLASGGEDPQRRGYGLEDLLAELFELHDIMYRRPYRTSTEQIDGHFDFKGFDYLVEARWRATAPTESDLGAFKLKVDKKLTSTRGLFVSMCGFRPEVVMELTRGTSSNLVLVDGTDLALILEGHISLPDALDVKIQKAAQEGIIFFPLRERFG